MKDIDIVIKRYTDLIISQYKNKLKMLADFSSLAKIYLENAFVLHQVANVLDFRKASGKQLDLIGKIIGVNRLYYQQDSNLYSLSDSDFRLLIDLKRQTNLSNYSSDSINTIIFNVFKGDVLFKVSGALSVAYYVAREYSDLLLAAMSKKIIPCPMNVKIAYVIKTNKRIFMYSSYHSTKKRSTNSRGYIDYNKTKDNKGIYLGYNSIIVF